MTKHKKNKRKAIREQINQDKTHDKSDVPQNTSAKRKGITVCDAVNAILLETEGSTTNLATSTPKAYGSALMKALLIGRVISSSSGDQSAQTKMNVDVFFEEFWGIKPVALRPKRKINENLACGKDDVRQWLKTQNIIYVRDLDVTNCIDGVRHTYNEDGEASEKVLDTCVFSEGKSLRILRPQQYSRPCWRMLSCLEAYFGRGGGINLYLTPGSNQGFQAHYDDIEAILVQIEGRKAWTVYHEYEGSDPEAMSLFPKNPRFSSGNFSVEQLQHLDVAFEVMLEPGDVLYLPRGTVHHAYTPETDDYSVHVTFSVGQLATYADLLLEALPRALQRAIDETNPESDPTLRESLPIGYQEYAGVRRSDLQDDPARQLFQQAITDMCSSVLPHLDLDSAADSMDRKFLHDRHSLIMVAPPAKAQEINTNHVSERRFRVSVEGAQNLSVEGDAVLLYHAYNNTRVYHEADPAGIEFGFEDCDALEALIFSSAAKPVSWSEIPHDSDEDRERVVSVLLDQNIIVEVGSESN